LRYALAPLCIGLAVLLHLSPGGPLFHPMGLFILGVVAAAWFGGPGPGVFAAFLSAIALPHLIAITYPLSLAYPLLAGVFDLPRFITLGLTGGAVGWGTSSLRRAKKTLRERGRELSKARDELEIAVAERTAHLTASEDALRLSEERYALAMEASEEGHFDWKVQTDEIFASVHMKQLLGLPVDTEYRTRSDMHARVRYYPGDRQRFEERNSRVLGGLDAQNEFEFRILRGDEVRWLRASWKIFRDADGVAQRVIGVVADITERKQAVNTLRESEARFRRMTELSADTYWEQDENLRYTRTGTGEDIAGYATDVNQGKTRWELGGEATPLSSTWLQHEAVLIAQQAFRDFEYRRRRPDGTFGYYSVSGAPMFDAHGRFRGYQGVARDITERRKVEDDLRSRQEMLDLAQKSARAIAFEWRIGTGEGQNRWSSDLEAMYGFASGGYDGTFETWKKVVHPEDWPAVNEAVGHAHLTGDVAFEHRVVHPHGSVHWLQARGRMFFDAAGSPIRMVGFMQEVTGRKQAEEDMRALEQKLRRSQRLEAMGTLAGGIAHDFNNILGAILGYGEMALRDAKKDTRLRRDLESIMAAGERGRALVERILAVSRSGVGERVPVYVEAVVREALDQLAAKLPANVTIAPRLQAGRAAMLGDSTQVHQVVMNLVTNAVQAMPRGGVLRVSLEAARLVSARAASVGTVAPGEYLLLKVKDSGTGIPAQVLERMFDPFFTTKEIGVGSGLGLSLVHGIVASVGGAIDVATELGKGSSFTVYLRRSGDAPEEQADENLPLPRGEGQRVLVVDDEEPLVRLATETLELLGYAPVAFTSSTAALAAFRADPQRFDAVLTDERMPGLSGSALIREVRGIRQAIPVVLMSGYLGMKSVDADVVVRKPLSAGDLAASMARVLLP
jgi:PAS domain S-box-containing protein